jgi:hypothetical protein
MGEEEEEEETTVKVSSNQEEEAWNLRKQTQIVELSERLMSGDLKTQIEAARDIRKLVRKSSAKTRTKLAAAGVIQPLIFMLLSPNFDARHASLLALLNLAVRNERYLVSLSLSYPFPFFFCHVIYFCFPLKSGPFLSLLLIFVNDC